MRTVFLIALFSLIANGSAYTQIIVPADTAHPNHRFEKVHSLSGKFSAVEVDALGNIYLIRDAELLKFTAAGDSVAVYSGVKRLGQPATVDVSNPFKTLLYYPKFTTIILLDNMLAERGQINLRKSGIFLADAVGISYDNQVWVFDAQDFKLKKLDENGSLLLESPDLRFAADIAPLPTKLFDHNGIVYLYDPALGFVLMDYYGAHVQTLAFPGWEQVSVTANTMWGIKDAKIFQYESASLMEKTFALPEELQNGKRILISNGNIYLLHNGGLEVYRLPASE